VFGRALEEQNISPRTIVFSSIRGMRACLKRGLGLTLCPQVSVEEDLKENRLIRLNLMHTHDEVSLIMIWHAEKWCSPLLKYFMRLSEEVMSESSAESHPYELCSTQCKDK
jgi:DNA-binding transcriptional LysR family regulator